MLNNALDCPRFLREAMRHPIMFDNYPTGALPGYGYLQRPATHRYDMTGSWLEAMQWVDDHLPGGDLQSLGWHAVNDPTHGCPRTVRLTVATRTFWFTNTTAKEVSETWYAYCRSTEEGDRWVWGDTAGHDALYRSKVAALQYIKENRK